jgi:protein-S-isoprenylcysteine O-methyltransferase Ste14
MKEKLGEHPVGDAGQIVAFGVFLVVWGLDSFLLHKSTFLSRDVPLFVRLSALIAFLAVAFSLVKAGHAVIDHAQGPSKVMSTGALRYVRHPLYLGCVLFYVGFALATLSLVSIALAFAIFVFYDYLASYEERFMESKFGDEYASYKAKTGKWLPKFRGG